MSGIDTFSPDEYYRTDYGTLASGRILQAEQEVAGCLNRSADLEAHALELIVAIQDQGLWKEHIDPQSEEPRWSSFWTVYKKDLATGDTEKVEGYVDFFVEAYGGGFGIRYGAETIRQRVSMYRDLAAAGHDTEGLMRKVLDQPLAEQQKLRAIVDTDKMELKGVPDSHEAAMELTSSWLEGDLAPSSLSQLSSGPSVFFRYDDTSMVAVWTNDDGVDEWNLFNWDDHSLPAVVRAAIIAKLGAKPKNN